jgi:hypothetical protein
VTEQVSAKDPTTVVHWFIKLPDPVDLPVGRGWQSPPDAATDRIQLVSIAGRQLDRPDTSVNDYDDARSAALVALPGTSPGSGASTPPTRPVTVVEMVAVFSPGFEPGEPELSDAFDIGVEIIGKVLASYALVTKDPVRVPRRESLPPMIPMFVRHATSEDPGYPGDEGIFLVNLASTRSSIRPKVEDADWERAATFFSYGDYEFAGYVATRLAGFRAMDRDGDYRGAVLAFATAAEMLLDDVLLHLLWHEAVRPEDAAQMFLDPRSSPLSRSRAHLPSRLGGDWNQAGTGPFAAWHRDVASLRNRVVHGGYSPMRAEANACRTAATGIEQYIVERLATDAVRARYPLTIDAMIGRPGMQRRGIYSKGFQAKLGGWVGAAPPAVLFKRWRTALNDERMRVLGENIPDLASSDVLVVRRRGGATEWWAWDARAGFARRIADRLADLRPALRAGLTDHLADLDARPQDQDVSTKVEGLVGGTPTGDWMLAHRRLPLAEAMFDGSDDY